MKAQHLILAAFLLTGSVAGACPGPMAETRTFFVELPAATKSKPIAAKVEILSTLVDKNYQRISKAKVLEAVRGTKKDVVLTIRSETHSCDRDPDIEPGKVYYVAGDVGKDGLFYGVWRQKDLIESK